MMLRCFPTSSTVFPTSLLLQPFVRKNSSKLKTLCMERWQKPAKSFEKNSPCPELLSTDFCWEKKNQLFNAAQKLKKSAWSEGHRVHLGGALDHQQFLKSTKCLAGSADCELWLVSLCFQFGVADARPDLNIQYMHEWCWKGTRELRWSKGVLLSGVVREIAYCRAPVFRYVNCVFYSSLSFYFPNLALLVSARCLFLFPFRPTHPLINLCYSCYILFISIIILFHMLSVVISIVDTLDPEGKQACPPSVVL